jgi:hypothetical protein
LCPLPAQENSKPVNEYAYNLQERLEEVYYTARQHLMASAERQKKDYDTRLTKHTYKTGIQFTNLIKQFTRTASLPGLGSTSSLKF